MAFGATVVLTARPDILSGLLRGEQCRASTAVGEAIAGLSRGAMAAFTVIPPTDLGALPYDGSGTAARKIAQLEGKVILLNLWATWCAPCREEMPWLAALHTRLAGDDFAVVAVSIDARDASRPEQFLAATGAQALRYHREPTLTLFGSLRAAGLVTGMPTTLLLGPDGCAVGVLAGAAGWDTPEAEALVGAAVAAVHAGRHAALAAPDRS